MPILLLIEMNLFLATKRNHLKQLETTDLKNRQYENRECIECSVQINTTAKNVLTVMVVRKEGRREQRTFPNFPVLLTSHYLN